ncbi:hypothetical protein RHOSPDRAFT_35337 [Rhodotorula sp. JG-1b]|nr:hypothetical protein RHOSPDRAFT_35337 [Rhodotorula sp. JG-1b]
MKRTKSRRTRSPLSLWAITATATFAALSAAAASASASLDPPPTLLQQPAVREVAAVTRPVLSTSPAFPSGILGFEAVGQELGHLGRHAESFGEDRWRRAGSLAEQLHRRQRRQGSIASTSPAPSNAGGTAASATASSTFEQVGSSTVAIVSGTSSAPTSTSTAVPEGYTLPQPFDSTLGTNFSSTACPSFFATFLADPTFQACAPFSLLLTTSTGFFQAERSPTSLLPHVLDASCSAPADTCINLMDSLARKLKLQNTCAKDLSLGNPLVAEALDGFNNYRLMRSAGCQRSNSTRNYCFADAATKEDPSDLYLYYLPEGTTLPSGTSPECDSCTESLMSIYASYATNSTLPISRTYASGRAIVALSCGPTFAPVVTPVPITSAATAASSFRLLGLASAALTTAVMMINLLA